MPGPVSGRGQAVPPLLRRHKYYGPSIRPGIGRTSTSHNRRNAGRSPAFLGKFALGYSRSAARSRSRPGPPPLGGGPVHFSLDGRQGGGVPFYRGKRPHRWSGLARRSDGGFFSFSGVGVNLRIFGWMSGASTSIRAHIRNSRLYVWMD